MAQINVIGKNGGRTIDLELPEVNSGVLHDVVTWQLASRRRGTASTKTRAEVSKTGKKMYGQKGTGNARHGDRSVPSFVGGGVAFGPKPRSYSYTLPRKVRQLGLAMALAARQEAGKLIAVDGYDQDGKTKNFVAWAKENGMDGSERVLIVTDDAATRQAARNVAWATVLPVAGLNAYDILRHERLVIDAVVLEPAQEGEEA
ncbi:MULTISPECIES: 50S ribosomal protein L4 [Deinococcus]|jgi:large subunit ribosomal protein L4|uniref:Large ribosomal subunit protein uL4 n=5 Tax=Deinococcus TaxID=1298 RepID=A0A0F7JQB1_9DEIO|nr:MULTISPECIES: 50S ribosomal protein L4 [Deinococcus]AKH16640.1 50S ribosomal protein L4 [Deinococcus soli (ex Cha et al. 2016)]MDK2013417.1 50S ribosomal protein L4 [Deinococcus sp. 43]MDR6217142.1 large subunit ribosomal protein L4 [Deinococcus soli (ex Cha et al. 2016)]MDR6327963.1 large subunit ribosomal protein L4 [Deinococcus soli (ex Cha et al. 2016)]MDR6750238.1 large subunit ribosomal protein L4 [Deinococcus soli (ex Cha et al. 2016)]